MKFVPKQQQHVPLSVLQYPLKTLLFNVCFTHIFLPLGDFVVHLVAFAEHILQIDADAVSCSVYLHMLS